MTSCASNEEIVRGSPEAAATAVRFAAATWCCTAAASPAVAARMRTSTAKDASSRRPGASRIPITSTCQLGSLRAAAKASPREASMLEVNAAAGRSLVMARDTSTDGAGCTVKVTVVVSLAATRESTASHAMAVIVAVVWSKAVAFASRPAPTTHVGDAWLPLEME